MIDSLQNELIYGSTDNHLKAMTMVRLADAYSYNNPSLGLQKNTEALSFAKKNRDDAAGSFAFSSRAIMEFIDNQPTLAQKAVDSAFFYAKKAPDFYKGVAWYKQGFLQNMQNYPDKALTSWQTALNYLKQPSGALYKSSIHYLIYGIYAERNDAKKASENAHLSLKAAVQSKDAGMMTAAWQINGTDYLQSFQTSKDSVFLDSALFAFQKSVKIFKNRKGWIKNQSVVALSALNIADIYLDYYPPWYKDSILNQVNLALEVSLKSGNKAMQANSYQIISKLNIRNGALDKAEDALQKEMQVVEAIDPPNYYLLVDLYQSLSELMEKKGDNVSALKYYKRYLEFYQKEFDAKQFATIQQLDARYQSEKKNKELSLLQQKNSFQKKQTYLYTGISAAAVLSLIFLFTAYNFRLKYSLQREKLLKQEKDDANLLAQLKQKEADRLTLEKQEAELQSRLKTEEAARLQAEQKLMTSQKEQLQKELMAGVLQIEHKNQLLGNLKEKLNASLGNGSAAGLLEKIINEEMRVDEDFENIKSEFKEVNPEFFGLLQRKAVEKLSQLDLKYCAYIYMKLSTKQIALLLHVEPKSVRMARYRIKQKLGLTKGEELDDFIQQERIS
ncbi:hypothetical protein [Pedobacter sp. UYP30]|uniref:hypothetical protein n=1 Tax=Pedobacter sp. UYP30 TaxID=1756400 RepID=UPI003390C8B7